MASGDENGGPDLLCSLRFALWRAGNPRKRRVRGAGAGSVAPDRPGALRQGQGRAGARLPSATGCSTRCKRTRPKDDADPGWQRISWDEALDTDRRPSSLGCRASTGPRASFSARPRRRPRRSSTRWTGFSGCGARSAARICASRWSCAAGAATLRPLYTYGAPVPGVYLPDLENAGCILFWGYNPSVARLAHATATVAALERAARG